MKIGYACVPALIPQKTTRSFILKNFSKENFYETLKLNLEDLKTILEYNLENNIYMFRISSDIVPFGSHNINDINWWEIFHKELKELGDFIKNNNIRVSMHPGQYTVLNSPSEDIVKKAIKDLEYHCRFLDSLEVDYKNKIVLHVGGVYGDKASATERFEVNFRKLSPSTKKRLILENDEKSYTIEDVLKICKNLKIPAVFDNLHHKCNPSLVKNASGIIENNIKNILEEVSKTWKSEDGNMKLHYSDGDNSKSPGAHSKFISTENFLKYYSEVASFDPDIMLEVKDKDLSAIKSIHCLQSIEGSYFKPLKRSTLYHQWAKYKYSVMEKNYAYYKECSKIVNSDKNIVAFYKYVDFALSTPFNTENFKNTLYHTWGYFKNLVTEKEKAEFELIVKNLEALTTADKINSEELIKSKNFIKKLSKKYNCKYLLDSYYFTY